MASIFTPQTLPLIRILSGLSCGSFHTESRALTRKAPVTTEHEIKAHSQSVKALLQYSGFAAFLLVCVFFFNDLLGAFTGTGVLKIPYLAVVPPGKVDDVVIRLVADAISLNPNHIRPPYDLRTGDVFAHKADVRHFELDLTQP